MNSLTFLIKLASSLCNMRCRYCFYEDIADNRSQKSMGIMTEATTERIISEAFRVVSPGRMVTFMFQGGEPTLAGLSFFKRFIALPWTYWLFIQVDKISKTILDYFKKATVRKQSIHCPRGMKRNPPVKPGVLHMRA